MDLVSVKQQAKRAMRTQTLSCRNPTVYLSMCLPSKEYTFGTQDLSCEVNKTMQVDESDGLHAAGKDAKFDLHYQP